MAPSAWTNILEYRIHLFEHSQPQNEITLINHMICHRHRREHIQFEPRAPLLRSTSHGSVASRSIVWVRVCAAQHRKTHSHIFLSTLAAGWRFRRSLLRVHVANNQLHVRYDGREFARGNLCVYFAKWTCARTQRQRPADAPGTDKLEYMYHSSAWFKYDIMRPICNKRQSSVLARANALNASLDN